MFNRHRAGAIARESYSAFAHTRVECVHAEARLIVNNSARRPPGVFPRVTWKRIVVPEAARPASRLPARESEFRLALRPRAFRKPSHARNLSRPPVVFTR